MANPINLIPIPNTAALGFALPAVQGVPSKNTTLHAHRDARHAIATSLPTDEAYLAADEVSLYADQVSYAFNASTQQQPNDPVVARLLQTLSGKIDTVITDLTTVKEDLKTTNDKLDTGNASLEALQQMTATILDVNLSRDSQT